MRTRRSFHLVARRPSTMSRDGLRTFSELLAETQHDDYAGDLSPVYATFTAEAANTRTQAELLAVAASNPNFVAYAMFTTNNQLQLFYLLTTVAVAIGPGASNLAGSTLAILGELGELRDRPSSTSGAMALFCAGVDSSRIRLLGRWNSWAMLRYLHLQANSVMSGFASKMLSGGTYDRLASDPPPDRDPEPPDAPPIIVPAPP